MSTRGAAGRLGGRTGVQKPFPLAVAKQGQQPPSLGIAYGGGGIRSCGGFVPSFESGRKETKS